MNRAYPSSSRIRRTIAYIPSIVKKSLLETGLRGAQGSGHGRQRWRGGSPDDELWWDVDDDVVGRLAID